MVYIKPLLASHNKKALDFISYICDERKNWLSFFKRKIYY